MSDTKLVVVGGGQMGRALVGGMLASNLIPESSLQLVEPSEDSRSWWAENYPDVVTGDYAEAFDIAERATAPVPGGLKGIAPADETVWLLK